MRKEDALKALRLERIWVALNLVGVAYYLVKTWDFATPSYAVAPNPIEFNFIAVPILGVFFLLDLIWMLLVVASISRQRRTGYSLFVVLLVGILWVGTVLFVRYRIDCVIEEVQQ
jgi:hypothetical protein